MERLTERKIKQDKNLYFTTTYSIDSNSALAAYKLGLLEDIELKLGIDLITLFQTLEKGFYFKFEDRIEKANKIDYLSFVFNEEDSYIHYDYFPKDFFLSDFKKTWAIEKSDLEANICQK